MAIFNRYVKLPEGITGYRVPLGLVGSLLLTCQIKGHHGQPLDVGQENAREFRAVKCNDHEKKCDSERFIWSEHKELIQEI